MSTSLLQSTPAIHPQPITPGEQARLAEDIRRCLLEVPSAGDQKVMDRKKDIRKRFNKAPETLAQFLVHAFNERRPISKRLTAAIGDFFAARTPRAVLRRLRELDKAETKEEYDVNQVQLEVAHGDLSTPTLIRLITEIDEHVEVLQEMRAAAVAELQKPGREL